MHNKCGLDDVLEGTTETTRRIGVTRNFEKAGGYNDALNDFRKLNQSPERIIKTKYGDGLLGSYGGSNMILRNGSKTGGATLEIQFSRRIIYKIRYLEVI